jgi:hypothetical protein
MSLMLLYALGTEVFRLDRTASRVLIGVAVAVSAVALVVRYVRLRRIGVKLYFLNTPPIPLRDRTKYLLWLVGASILGAYSVRELQIGGFWLGVLGCGAALSSMFVLARGLIRPPRE